MADTDVYELRRTDDHGNEFLVEGNLTYEVAEAKRQAFEAKAHKQTYWLKRVTGESGSTAERASRLI